jgi:16S rRNA processing protein RimM
VKLVTGRLVKPHGVRGELVLEVHTDAPEQRFTVGSVHTTEPPERGPIVLRAVRRHQGRLLVMLEGVTDRTAAERLSGTAVVADGATSPRIHDPDEFWDHQLIGLAVELPDGRRVGEVADVLHPRSQTGQELLAVRLASDGREVLVPFVVQVVPRVDVDQGVVVIDPPEGLLEV